jgi:hypothetical protein
MEWVKLAFVGFRGKTPATSNRNQMGASMNLPYETNIIIALCIVGFCLLGVGYSFRDRGWGLALVWIGVITMMGPIAYRLLVMF